MFTLLMFIVAVIWGMVQMYTGEWTNGFMLWLLAYTMSQAANSHVESEAARRFGHRNGSKLEEIEELVKRFIRRIG